MAACAAVINGGGNIPCYHNFGILLATVFPLTAQGLIRAAVEPQVPVEAVLGNKNLVGQKNDVPKLTFVPMEQESRRFA